MMAKEKALELTMKYHKFGFYSNMEEAKTNALILANEIISLNIKYHGREIEDNKCNIEYWQEVKKEIEIL